MMTFDRVFTLPTITIIDHFLGSGSCNWPTRLWQICLPSKWFYLVKTGSVHYFLPIPLLGISTYFIRPNARPSKTVNLHTNTTEKWLGSNDAAIKTTQAYERDLKFAWPKMAHPMDATKPTNDQMKAMFRWIKFSTDAATELVTGKGIYSIKEMNNLTQDCVTHLC